MERTAVMRKTMSKKSLLSALIMAFMMASVLCLSTFSIHTFAADAQQRQGLKKEGSAYYFYKDGERVTNTWKTVKGNKYYFGKDGKAYRCTSRPDKYYDSTQIIVVKTINGKKYGFDYKARLAKGVYADKKGRLYSFNRKTGVYNASNTKKLRNLVKKGKNAATLRKYIEKLDGKKGTREAFDSCNPPGALDVVYEFAHVRVTAFRAKGSKTDKMVADAVEPK